MQKSYQANVPRETLQDRQMKRKKNGSRQQGFGAMAGDGFLLNVCATLNDSNSNQRQC